MEKLNRTNLLDLMNRMKSMVPAEDPAPECTDIVWTAPHHFSREAMTVLTAFGNKLASYLEKTLQYLCDDSYEAQLEEIREYFACFLVNEVNESQRQHYFLPLKAPGKGHIGFIGLSFEACTALISQILRDTEAVIGEDGELSSLEESILQDIISSIADTFIDAFSEYGQVKVEKTEQLVQGEWPVRFRDLEDMCSICFDAHTPSGELKVMLYLLDEAVDPIVGIPLLDTSAETKKEIPGRIVGQMQAAPLEVTARLSSAMMTLNDILSLEKNDVIVLDRKVTSPVEVLVNGQMCFQAWPVQSARHQAVMVC